MKNKYIVFTAVALLFFNCNNKYDELAELSFNCDMENSTFSNFIASNGIRLSGADFKSSNYSRSGNYSAMVENGHDKALDININNVAIGDQINVRVWRLKQNNPKSFLALLVGSYFYYYESDVSKTEGDWELLEINIEVAKEFPGEGMRVYVQNSDDQPAYFDDLSVTLKRNGGMTLKPHPVLPEISLKIKKEGLEKIEIKRLDAIKNRVLIKGSDDWVNVKANWGSENASAKIRLKGDWTDHLYGQKVSFRLNVKNDKTLNDYSKFSIQNPVSRHYLDEWFVHQMLMQENVLTTRYEFADLYINGKSKGMYAIEEHFTDNLLIAQHRKPGVILKYDEDEFWLSRFQNKAVETKGVPWIAAAKIKTFSTKSVFADSNRTRDFFRGRDLLYQFHFKTRPVNEIIDLDKMAAFLALVDISVGYHGLMWHNLRFYYNADSNLLEPVAYDLFSEEIHPPENYNFLGQLYLKHPDGYTVRQFNELFVNPDFLEKYIYYLKKFTKPDFFKNERAELDSLFLVYETELKKEYAFYRFSMDRYTNRATIIRNELDEFEKDIYKKLKKKNRLRFNKFSTRIDYLPIKNVSLKANLVDSSGTYILQLRGYYNKPLVVKAAVGNGDTLWFSEPIKMPAYLSARAPEIMRIQVPVNPNMVLYQTLEGDSVYSQKVVKYRAPLK